MFLNIAHRGAAGHALENSVEAFEFAKTVGSRAVEFDVQLTSDGIPVIMHDKLIDRTTNQSGFLRDMSYEYICENVRLLNMELVPTLADVLQIYENEETIIYMEIIDPSALDASMDLIRKYKMTERTVISSFVHGTLRAAKHRFKDCKTMILFECSPIDPVKIAKEAGADEVGAGFESATQTMLSALLEAGFPTFAWTVNDKREIELARNMGFSGIFTDYCNV